MKPRDYEPCGQVEALHEYDAWRMLRDSGKPLEVGDLLEGADGQLRICKYVGFEPAQWVLPESKHAPEPGDAPERASEPPAPPPSTQEAPYA